MRRASILKLARSVLIADCRPERAGDSGGAAEGRRRQREAARRQDAVDALLRRLLATKSPLTKFLVE